MLETPSLATLPTSLRTVQVLRKTQLARDTWHFVLQDPQGQALPTWEAGAHVMVQTPAGLARHYSLCGQAGETGFYEIAVKRDAAGRGGSLSMADALQVGDLIGLSAPLNEFALHPGAKEFILIAGGIGITPLLAMARQLAASGQGRFKLYYLTRDAAATAFAAELQALSHAGEIHIHHDGGDPQRALDLWPIFEKPGKAQVYCCGPRGLMDGVRDMSGHWPSGQIHFESFGVDAQTRAGDHAFRVVLDRSGQTVQVSAQQSILEALRASGYPLASSCESGSCGTCRTGLLAGQVEHRDFVLREDEHSSQIMVCVSRARDGSETLVLDL